MPKKIAPEKKNQILKRAAEIGAAAAAKEAGVSYNAVLKWVKANSTSKTDSFDDQIAEKMDKIKEVEESLKALKAELKVLNKAKEKAKEKADKEKAVLAEVEKKKELLAALEKSGKTLEEVLEFLK